MSVYVLLLLVALSVSSLHMIAPDHWLPLTVISSAKAYSSTKKYGVAAGLGFAHAATSIVVAMAIFYAGLVLIHSYVSYLLLAGEVLLVIIGLYFIIYGYRESHEETSFSETSAISVSAFPDLALLPIVISGATLSNLQIGTILLVFFLASGVALTAMVFIAGKGLGKAISKVPPKYMDYLIGGVLIATAVFIRFI